MNKGRYIYCLLQYQHSQLLGELLNIGLLVYFPELKKLDFIYPEKLIRLKFVYPEIPEKTIKSYFKYFNSRVSELNNHPELFADYDLSKSLESFVHKELLPSDSSAIQFRNYRTSVLYTSDITHITNQLYNLYFSVFQVRGNEPQRIDETVLLNNYKSLIKEFSREDSLPKDSQNFHFDYSIKPSKEVTLTFDVAWQHNHTLHLVQPVSFDLKRQDTINKKAYQFYGQFIDLQELAEDKNYLFDVILAKPRNKSLFGAYDNAIRLLEKPKRVTLVEYNELNSYSKTTAESVLT